jgi:hypothetical protein
MQVRSTSLAIFAAASMAAVSALAQPSQGNSEAQSPTGTKSPGGKTTSKPAPEKWLHDGLSPRTINQASKRKSEVPAAMRSVPAEVKGESNCHSKASDA